MHATTESKRERIMVHLAQRFAALRSGVDGYSATFSRVQREPLKKTEMQVGTSVCLFDTDEDKTAEIGFYRCALMVTVEFFYPLKLGDNPSTQLNRLLLDVQRCMRQDITCGGLTFNVVEVRNELDVDGPADRLVAGVADFLIQYRHSLDDPRS